MHYSLQVVVRGGESIDEQSKENCPTNRPVPTLTTTTSPSPAPSPTNEVEVDEKVEEKVEEEVGELSHNEIFVQMGDKIQAHSLQVGYCSCYAFLASRGWVM